MLTIGVAVVCEPPPRLQAFCGQLSVAIDHYHRVEGSRAEAGAARDALRALGSELDAARERHAAAVATGGRKDRLLRVATQLSAHAELGGLFRTVMTQARVFIFAVAFCCCCYVFELARR